MRFARPERAPGLLADLDFADPPAALQLPPPARIEGGRLLAEVPVPGVLGLPVGAPAYRDVVFEAQLALEAGGPGDLYGIFVRRTDAGRSVCFAMGPEGRSVIRHLEADGATGQDVVDGVLAPDLAFTTGVGAPNLFQVVAFGPQLGFAINDQVVLGVMVERGLAEGGFGVFALRSGDRPVAVSCDWAQVRSVLPRHRRLPDASTTVVVERLPPAG